MLYYCCTPTVILVIGSLFSCEKCSSTFLDSRYRGTRKSVNVVYPSIRYSQSGSHLVLCRPCGKCHSCLLVRYDYVLLLLQYSLSGTNHLLTCYYHIYISSPFQNLHKLKTTWSQFSM